MKQTTRHASGEFSKYTTKHALERRLVEGFLRTFDDSIPSTQPKTILEVGVGEGMIAERIKRRYPRACLVVLDLPDPRLADLWRSKGLRGVFADAAHLPFRDSSIDLIVGIEVLEHLPAPGSALGEMARVGNGHAMLSVPLEPLWRIGNVLRGRYLGRLGNTPDHLQHWSRRRFEQFVSRHFDIERVRRPIPWTLVVARVRRPSAS